MKGLNVLLAVFGTQVGSPRIANKTKQGIGRRIVVEQAEVRSTSNHFNKEEVLIARNARNSGKTRNIPYNNNLRRRNEKQENKDYIYTQATDNAGQVRTIKAGQTKTTVSSTMGNQ